MADQPLTPFDTAKIIRCGTTEYMNMLKKADPQFEQRLNDYENQLQAYIRIINPLNTQA